MSRPYQALQCLLNPQQGVGVLLFMGVQTVEVKTEAQTSVFLSDQDHCIIPCTLTGLYGA